jgi:hypothetical protein
MIASGDKMGAGQKRRRIVFCCDAIYVGSIGGSTARLPEARKCRASAADHVGSMGRDIE